MVESLSSQICHHFSLPHYTNTVSGALGLFSFSCSYISFFESQISNSLKSHLFLNVRPKFSLTPSALFKALNNLSGWIVQLIFLNRSYPLSWSHSLKKEAQKCQKISLLKKKNLIYMYHL